MTFTITLKLKITPYQEKKLDQSFFLACRLYNNCVKDIRKRINNLYADKQYKILRQTYLKNGKYNTKEKEMLKDLRTKYDLKGRFTFEEFLKYGRYKYSHLIDSDTCNALSKRLWKATEEVLFSKGKTVRYKEELYSLVSKTNKQGIIYRDGYLKYIGLTMPIIIRESDSYAKECLTHKIKYCGIVRKWHKNHWRYYAELYLEGEPPIKNRVVKEGLVGIDLGTSTLAVVSENKMIFKELNDGLANIDNEIYKLNRKLDRQLRANNPQNYNENGTVKRDTKTFKKIWYHSNEYKKTINKIRELYAKRTNKSFYFQTLLANEVIRMGDCFVLEKMSFSALQRRSSKTEISEKTGKFKRKKRYGKSIEVHAPGRFQVLLQRRIEYNKAKMITVNNRSIKASKLNHITGELMDSDINIRWKNLTEDISVQRDLYSAFLLSNIKNENEVDINKCNDTFNNFLKLHNELIKQMRLEKKQGKRFPACMGL